MRPARRIAAGIEAARRRTQAISRQFSTSRSTLSASIPVVRHSSLPGLAVVECGTAGACGWNAVAVALQCHMKHAPPGRLLATASVLGQ
eukprot:15473723-Alexandrium_andersonii.AAC.1